MIDYIIVGSGLAGIAFAETALNSGKTILVFDNHSQNSSTIAGGLYNPVILKRFSKLQQAQEQLLVLQEFYDEVESKLDLKLNFRLPVLRKFFSVEEQNNWFTASDKPGLSPFLSTKLIHTKYSGIDSPFGYGEVLQTGYVETAQLLQSYQKYLKDKNQLVEEVFDYDLLESNPDFVRYKNIHAKHIVFAEGFGLHANPFFKHLPLDGTKGELFIIKAPNLNLDVILNTNVFILPLGNDLFKVGATYNWEDKTNQTTEAGKAELIEKISEILNCNFEIIEHLAGVRPTVKDRRPLLGTHAVYSNIHIFNGLGTRGVMLGPFMAKVLFDHIEFGTPIDRENDIKRFDKKK
ncbi:FAD-dependent oxidoreductase [Flavobacterium noncentrifugens]|nr:FAD-dependent oxidoreductase [Flavobacterium noncentrifugens]GEP49441.1 FAD-dependent oxidoreductase [Flavobacterium noncentrifugens]